MKFQPCVNRTACTEDGTHCRSCGRSHEEIMRTRLLINSITAFASEMDYENNDDFLTYLTKKVGKKLKYAQAAND